MSRFSADSVVAQKTPNTIANFSHSIEKFYP